MASYNVSVVTQLLREWIDASPRGAQSNLARVLGIGPQAVNKWYKGGNNPEPDKWPAIEDFFGKPRGTLARESGYYDRVHTPEELDEISQLRAEVAELRAAVEEMRRGTPPGAPR